MDATLDQKIIDYGARLAPYTFAPVDFNREDISIRWHYPFPDESMMNAGWLRLLDSQTEEVADIRNRIKSSLMASNSKECMEADSSEHSMMESTDPNPSFA